MVQAWNAKAFFTLASVVRRPSLMVPHVTVQTISRVDFAQLQRHAGIQAVVFDKDNTLTLPYVNQLHEAAHDGLQQCIRVFGRDKVAILSNSAGTLDDPDYEDAQRVEDALGIAVIRHDEKKPGGLDDVLKHFDIDDPSAVCMIGDRLLTDIVFGNLHGMLTIHTLPFTSNGDNVMAKVIRPVENYLLYGSRLGKRYLQRRKVPHKYWLGPADDDSSPHPLVHNDQGESTDAKENEARR